MGLCLFRIWSGVVHVERKKIRELGLLSASSATSTHQRANVPFSFCSKLRRYDNRKCWPFCSFFCTEDWSVKGAQEVDRFFKTVSQEKWNLSALEHGSKLHTKSKAESLRRLPVPLRLETLSFRDIVGICVDSTNLWLNFQKTDAERFVALVLLKERTLFGWLRHFSTNETEGFYSRWMFTSHQLFAEHKIVLFTQNKSFLTCVALILPLPILMLFNLVFSIPRTFLDVTFMFLLLLNIITITIMIPHSTTGKNNEGRQLPELLNPFGATTLVRLIQWGEHQQHSLVLF